MMDSEQVILPNWLVAQLFGWEWMGFALAVEPQQVIHRLIEPTDGWPGL